MVYKSVGVPACEHVRRFACNLEKLFYNSAQSYPPMKLGQVVLAFLLLIPVAYPMTIQELIAKLDFSTATAQMNITHYTDFMADKDENGINDTLVFELTTINTAGTFVFVVNLFDKNGILTNETNKTLAAGINKVNITFSSLLLSQEQFNYSIKVYN